MAKQQENKQEFDFKPYWALYPQAKMLYAVMIQGSYVVFDSKLKAERYQEEVKEMRGLETELKEITK